MNSPKRPLSVLQVTLGVPWPPDTGFRQRDYYLLRSTTRYHHVHLLCLYQQGAHLPDEASLRSMCKRVELFPIYSKPNSKNLGSVWQRMRDGDPLATAPYFSKLIFERIQQLLITEKFDIFQIEHSFLLPYRRATPKGFSGKTVLSLHNIGAVQYRRMVNLALPLPTRLMFAVKSLLMRNWEARHASDFDRVITCSTSDAQWLLRRNARASVSVIDNGVDAASLPILAAPKNEGNLLFVGSMIYPPNEDAMLYFCRSIRPLLLQTVPDAHLWIVGHEPAPRLLKLAADPLLHVTGYVEKLTPYYELADLVIVPLRAGSGSRLKILEAMAMGRAVVSTTLGCEGLELEKGTHLAIADDPVEFSRQIITLLHDKEKRCAMAERARRWVEKRYDWTLLGNKLITLYDELVSR